MRKSFEKVEVSNNNYIDVHETRGNNNAKDIDNMPNMPEHPKNAKNTRDQIL